MKITEKNLHDKQCQLCGKKKPTISEKLGVCKECILTKHEEAMEIISAVRLEYRKKYDLVPFPPKSPDGLFCGDCVNNCILAEGEIGFCNLVKNENGTLIRTAGDEKKGLFSFYYDPLPTNCVAAEFCPGSSAIGYPKYSYNNGPEIGRHNLAVFYQSCTYDCLFCQNYQYRKGLHISNPYPPEVLVEAIKPLTSCICFFGGDPASQIRHSNEVGRQILEKSREEEQILRVCWETNGSPKTKLFKESARIALQSGGCIKIDFKSFDNRLQKALCGANNSNTFQNLKLIGKLIEKRPDLPLLIASTLLIPGYIDVEQVRKISKFLASINPSIPYSLLAYYPAFVLDDLPTTSKKHAYKCLEAAKAAGLERVRIGNKHLLR
ncbi:MAG: radical SAM protein [Asgard group archaeon]|nr:radical SAM protein [Asgard group archaeon]